MRVCVGVMYLLLDTCCPVVARGVCVMRYIIYLESMSVRPKDASKKFDDLTFDFIYQSDETDRVQ